MYSAGLEGRGLSGGHVGLGRARVLPRSRHLAARRARFDRLIGGMWDVWHAKEEDRLYTFTVLTTFPDEVSAWFTTGRR